MKLTVYRCPECGEKLRMNVRGRDIVFCNFCGSRICVENDSGRQEICIRHEYSNETETEKHHVRRDIRLAEISARYGFWSGVDKEWLLYFIFMFLVLLFMAVVGIVSTFGTEAKQKVEAEAMKEQKTAQGYIYPGAARDFLDRDYMIVKSELEAMGFKDIEEFALDDLSLFDKILRDDEGKVTGISIKGIKDFDINNCFAATDRVIIDCPRMSTLFQRF